MSKIDSLKDSLENLVDQYISSSMKADVFMKKAKIIREQIKEIEGTKKNSSPIQRQPDTKGVMCQFKSGLFLF